MTEQDDELKDLFRQKNLENAFQPDEQNWNTMSSVLENDRRKKRLVYLCILLLVLGSTWLMIKDMSTGTQTLSSNSKAFPGNTTASTTDLPTETISPGKQKHVRSGKGTQHTAPVQQRTEQHFAPSQQQQAIPATPEVMVAHQPSDTREKAAMKAPLNELQRTISVKESAPSNSGSMPAEDQAIPVKAIVAGSIANKNSDVSGINISNIPGTVTNPPEQVPASGTPQVMGKTADLEPEVLGSVPGSLQTAPLQDTIRPDILAGKMIPASIGERNIDPVIYIPEKDNVSRHPAASGRIFLEAGTSWLPGWKTSGKTEANGFNPLIGLHYDRDIYKKLGFSLGLQYTTIAHLSQTSHTSTTTRIKFGEEVDYTVISAQKMHYALLPVKLNYTITRNDIIGLGYTLAYLLDVESAVKTYSTRVGYSGTPLVSKARGYTSGFNTYDGQLTVSYRRRLCKKGLFANAAFFYGLNDIKNGTYSETKVEKACGFRLSLDINVYKN